MFRRRLSHWLETFLCRPSLPIALEAALLVPLALGSEVPGLAPFYLVAAPWLLVALMALNLPVLAFLIQGFRLDAATRRNHALEHATVHFLEQGGAPRIGGRAEKSGFCLFGRVTAADIRTAFAEVAVRVEGGMPIPYLSPRCGSNRLSTLTLGTALLIAVTVASLALQPPVWMRVVALLAAVAIFHHGRERVGQWVQDRFFMATDFESAALRDIRQLRGSNRGGRLAFFVRTRVA